jgi:GT2 family glycosyltransferase/glycosyltransferase involved in cell wall biosynthesis
MTTTNDTDHTDAYQQWLCSHVFQHNDGVDFEERIATWQTTPRFHIAVAHDTASVGALAQTLHSLADQYYPHLLVTVASPLAEPEGLTSDRLIWKQTEATWNGANQALLDAGDDCWVGVLRAGDTVARHAFLTLAERIATDSGLSAIYTDEDVRDDDDNLDSPRFKPDFDLELLRSAAYLGGMLVTLGTAWRQAGGWRHFPAHSDELDMALRLSEILAPTAIGHCADILYHRHRSHPELACEPQASAERLACVNDHLLRCGGGATAVAGQHPGTAHIRYPLASTPRVSIVIPTRDQFALLERCIESLFNQTDYPDFEVLVVDNGSEEPAACAYLNGLIQLDDPRMRVLRYDRPFNFSAMNNLAAREATGSLLLLLNNDTAALHRGWLSEMVSLMLQPQVGMVGARLLYPDATIQHAGVILGLGGPAEHPFIGWSHERPSPLNRTHATQQLSAVTAACALVHRDLYLALGGMDEERFAVSYNDVDLCLRIRAEGYRILWTPHATLLHEGSASQNGKQANPASPQKQARFAAEQGAMYSRWMPKLVRDTAYNPNLSLATRDCAPEPEAALSWNPTPWNPRPRLLVHPIDLSGCGEYRILAPSRSLHDSGRCRGYASQRFFSEVEVAKAEVRSIVVQHPTTPRHVKALEVYSRYSGAQCIVEIDDLITDIPLASPYHRIHGADAVACFRRSLEVADRLVVATDALAEAFGAWAKEVVVQPNTLESSRWCKLSPRTYPPNRKPRVGWAGSISHVGDLRILIPVVKKLAREVDWVFLGLCPSALRPYVAEYHPPVSMDDYPAKLAELGLDVAIAPLESNAFNEAKSALKILEYGILGYPVVCSDIRPYRGGFPVTLVSNTEHDWVKAIRDLAHDPLRRAAEGRQLKACIEANWLLEQHQAAWSRSWKLD